MCLVGANDKFAHIILSIFKENHLLFVVICEDTVGHKLGACVWREPRSGYIRRKSDLTVRPLSCACSTRQVSCRKC